MQVKINSFFAFRLTFSCVIVLTLCNAGFSQALRDINYAYLYNPGEFFQFQMKPVRSDSEWIINSKLIMSDGTAKGGDFAIEWSVRESLSTTVEDTTAVSTVETANVGNEITYQSRVTYSATPSILVAKVINIPAKIAWYFYVVLNPVYPVKTFASASGGIITQPFVQVGDKAKISHDNRLVVSYYDDDFPTALPPFAEAQGRVPKGMKSDSTYFLQPGDSLHFFDKGLFLIQDDTTSFDGTSIRAERDYPKFGRISSLAGPLVYVSTKQEYDRAIAAKNDKKTFDRALLSITNDTERAKTFMRNYFRQVELANRYFTSYKEGWKSDRGMVYIVFGLPDEVAKLEDRELWTYKRDDLRATFTFMKSSSVFDPDNYVLIRDKKYQQLWYETIDRWRNARF